MIPPGVLTLGQGPHSCPAPMDPVGDEIAFAAMVQAPSISSELQPMTPPCSSSEATPEIKVLGNTQTVVGEKGGESQPGKPPRHVEAPLMKYALTSGSVIAAALQPTDASPIVQTNEDIMSLADCGHDDSGEDAPAEIGHRPAEAACTCLPPAGFTSGAPIQATGAALQVEGRLEPAPSAKRSQRSNDDPSDGNESDTLRVVSEVGSFETSDQPSFGSAPAQEARPAAVTPGIVTLRGATPPAAAPPASAHSHVAAVSITSPRFAEEVAIAVTRRIGSARVPDELIIRIEPAALGRIVVQLRFDDKGTLQATLTADQVQVFEQLKQSGGELHRALADNGVRSDVAPLRFERPADSALLSRSDQSFGGQQEQPFSQQQSRRQGSVSPTFSALEEQVLEDPSFQRLAIRTGQLNVVA